MVALWFTDFILLSQSKNQQSNQLYPMLINSNINYKDFSYLSIKNFLKTPEKAIELLSKYPAINGGVSTPGARQNLTPMDLVPVLQAYASIMTTVDKEINPRYFTTSSVIAWKGIKVFKNSHFINHRKYIFYGIRQSRG